MLKIFLFLFSTSLLATPLDLSKLDAKVSFRAIGQPSSLAINGEGRGISGLLERTGDKFTGTAEFDLTKLKTGISLRDKHTKEKYLEVSKYPTATLALKDVAPGPFMGELTLHGVTGKVEGSFELKDDKAVFKFSVDTSKFKIETPSFMEISVGKLVDVEVVVK